ncbi:MAG TPA: glycosyltransferase [Candidatus Limnocylindrales bacterium]
MPEPQSGGGTAADLTARTEREYLENRVVELEAETDELRRGLDGLAARVHFLRGELDRLGRVVRVGAAVRGAIRQPARLPGLPGELRRLVRGVPIPTDPPLAERRRTLAELAAAHRARVVEQVGRRQGAAPTPRPLASLRVGLVADEALALQLAAVCEIVPLRPNDWREALAVRPPDILLVESAWWATAGAWQYRIAWHPHPRAMALDELTALVDGFAAAGVPTAFWMTAGPGDVDRFAPASRLFDHLFVVDAASADRLAADPERRWATCAVLPPGVEPRRHHPDGLPVDRCPAFVGSFARALPLARREALEALLDAAMPFGLQIHDTEAGSDPERFEFPGRFARALAGRPHPGAVADVYRRHAVVLVPSPAPGSPSAVAPRLLEALASGTPVVTTVSAAATALAGDLATASDDPDELRAAIAVALDGEDARRRVRASGPGLAHRHDIRRRLAMIVATAGIPVVDGATGVAALLLCDGPGPEGPASIAAWLATGGAGLSEVVVGTTDWAGSGSELRAELSARLPSVPVRLVEQVAGTPAADRIRRLAAMADSTHVAILGPLGLSGPDVPDALSPDAPGAGQAGAPDAGVDLATLLAGLLWCVEGSGADVVAPPAAGAEAAHLATPAVLTWPAIASRALVLERGWPDAPDAETTFQGWASAGVRFHAADPFALAGLARARPPTESGTPFPGGSAVR